MAATPSSRFDLFVRAFLDCHCEVGRSVIFPDGSPRAVRAILRVLEVKIVRSVNLVYSHVLKREPFLDANFVFKLVSWLQNASACESTEVVAAPNVFDLFSRISCAEDVLIVSRGAITSALHE